LLPKYISDTGHGAASHLAPLYLSNVQSYFFTLRANHKALQKFVDSQLNVVSNGAVTYTALPWVLNCWYQTQKGTSMAEVGGYMPSNECLFVIPLLQQKHGHFSLPELKAWVPYLLIDQQNALITAREVWGYRKSLAGIQIPNSPGSNAVFSAETTVFPTFDRDKRGAVMELVKLRKGGSVGPFEPSFQDARGGFAQVIEHLGGVAQDGLSTLVTQAMDQAFGFLPTFNFPIINLKQFRDAVDGTRACYQALIDCPNKLAKLHGGGILQGDYTMEILNVQSHTIVEDLGLITDSNVPPSYNIPPTSSVVRPVFGQWANMDLEVMNGSVIWESSARRD